MRTWPSGAVAPGGPETARFLKPDTITSPLAGAAPQPNPKPDYRVLRPALATADVTMGAAPTCSPR